MPITIKTLQKMKTSKEKITVLTGYDASFAKLLDHEGIDIILVGDTLGEVFQGHNSTLPVSTDDMCYHLRAVTQGAQNAFIIGDMPFMSYASLDRMLDNATRLMQAGAHMVKMEGGAHYCENIRYLTQCGIPVCGHIGLIPQSVHKLGGYFKQGKTNETAEQLRQEALLLEKAGVDLLVLECIPSELASEITQMVSIPTIGIGSCPETDGQVLVLYDILGITDRKPSSFVQQFLDLYPTDSVSERIKGFINAVKEKRYPC